MVSRRGEVRWSCPMLLRVIWCSVMAMTSARQGIRASRCRPPGRRGRARQGRQRLSTAKDLRAWIGAWKFELREYEKIQKLLYELRHAEALARRIT